MPVYRPLPGITRVQKALPYLIVAVIVGVGFDFINLGVALANSGATDAVSYDNTQTAALLGSLGLLLKGLSGLVLLYLAIKDTADHDTEFNMPPGLAFLACCVPPLMTILPFVFLNIIVGHAEDKVHAKLPAVKLLLWLWCGFALAANAVSFVAQLEHLTYERNPLGDLLQAVLWTAAGVMSVLAMVQVTNAITEARKSVIREAAKLLGPSPDPSFSKTASPWNPNDPFRPRR